MKRVKFNDLHPYLKDTSAPHPFPSNQTPLLSYQKIPKNVKIKDHLEMADISGEDIFHVSDCCQNYPHVSQKTWVIIWFLAGLT